MEVIALGKESYVHQRGKVTHVISKGDDGVTQVYRAIDRTDNPVARAVETMNDDVKHVNAGPLWLANMSYQTGQSVLVRPVQSIRKAVHDLELCFECRIPMRRSYSEYAVTLFVCPRCGRQAYRSNSKGGERFG